MVIAYKAQIVKKKSLNMYNLKYAKNWKKY